MSGGSFSYLYCKDADNLNEVIGELDNMADALVALSKEYPARKDIQLNYIRVADRTRSLKAKYQKYLDDIQKEMDDMREVWRSVEMCYSCDSDKDGVFESVWKYTYGKPLPR